MIITYPLNGITYTAEDAESYLCTRTSGVFSSDNHFAISITDDREVTISPGLAWINNGDYTGKSVLNTESVAIAVPVSDGALDRIDRIVLRFDKAQNRSDLMLLSGTPASSPVAPAISRTELFYDLALYDIRVPAASVSIATGNITSNLLDETLCGLMRDGVTQIPTAQLQQQVNELMVVLQDQADALIEQLREEIAGVQDGSAWLLKSGGTMAGAIGFETEAVAAETRDNLGLAAVAASGSYNDLTDLPEEFTVDVDDTVTPNGTNPVSGAAVAAYVADQIAAIANYEGVEF